MCWDVMWGCVGEGVEKCVGCGRDVGVWKRVGRGVRRCVVGGVEKCFGVWGKMKKGVGKCVWVGGEMRKSVGMWGRCGKVCWYVGEVWGCGKVLGKMWESVLECGRDVGVRKSVEEV